LDAAEVLYLRAEQGIAALPRDCRPAIHAARLVYAEIGEQLSRSGLDSITQRTVVPRSRKLALLARAAGAAFVAPAGQTKAMTPLPAIAYLVEASDSPLASDLVVKERTVWRRFDDRMARLVEIHAHLVEHDRLTR
jgi:phytoene synthase